MLLPLIYLLFNSNSSKFNRNHLRAYLLLAATSLVNRNLKLCQILVPHSKLQLSLEHQALAPSSSNNNYSPLFSASPNLLTSHLHLALTSSNSSLKHSEPLGLAEALVCLTTRNKISLVLLCKVLMLALSQLALTLTRLSRSTEGISSRKQGCEFTMSKVNN